MTTGEIIRGGYRRLLKAYPAWFQSLFSSEMDAVFSQALEAAYRQGWQAVCRLSWRELRDWPGAVCWQYWLGWRMEVSKMVKTDELTNNEQARPDAEDSTEKTSTLATFAPLLLLLVWGAAWLYAAALDIFVANPRPGSTFLVFLVAHTISLIGMGVGWQQYFPRWSYLYVGMALTYSAYWAGLGMKGFTLPGFKTFQGGQWGWIAWLPFLVLVAIMLVWTRSWQPLKQFFIGIWKDWSRLSLVFYAWLVFLFMTIQLDSIEQPNEYWLPVWMLLAFLAGAYMYMLAGNPWKRALGLDLGLFAGVGGMIFLGWLLNPETQQFASYSSIAPEARLVYLLFMTGWVLVWLGLVFLPAVLVIFQRSKRVAPAV